MPVSPTSRDSRELVPVNQPLETRPRPKLTVFSFRGGEIGVGQSLAARVLFGFMHLEERRKHFIFHLSSAQLDILGCPGSRRILPFKLARDYEPSNPH